jgi:glycine/D-amino acid oxidase-like deaminating enzyme
MGYSSDGLPHVGQVPGQDGQYILAGFTGHGMPQIFLAAEGIAKMIVSGVNFEDTGLPRLFKSSEARLGSHENKIFDHNPKGSTQAKL